MHTGLTFLTVPSQEANHTTMKVMTKKDFDYYFLEVGMSRKQFKEELGVSDRVYHATYNYHYPDRKVRAAFAGARIAKSQKTRNSNARNAGKPRVILDKYVVKGLLEEGNSIFKIGALLKVAPQTVKANIDYHKLSLDEYYISVLGYSNVMELRHIDSVVGTSLLAKHKDLSTHPQEIIDEVYDAFMYLKSMEDVLRKIRHRALRYARDNNVKVDPKRMPLTKTNYLFGRAFTELGYPVIHEFELEGKFFDLLLDGTNILVEIDSTAFHTSESEVANDLLKNEVCARNGYEIFRIFTKKEKYEGVKIQVRQCLQSPEFQKLLQ